MSNDETIRLKLDTSQAQDSAKQLQGELESLEAAADDVGKAAGKMTEGTDKAAAGTKNLGRATLETGRVVQDFAQGGIGGILNNVEGLVSALGMGPGVAGLITGVGVAAFVATPLIKSMWKTLSDGPESIPVDPLERMNGALAESKERLDKLKESWGGSADEARAYNAALAETAKLEKEVTGERERRSALDKARKAEADAANPSSPEAAKVAQEVIAGMGGIDDAVNATRNALAGEDPKLKALREQAADLARRSAERREADPNNLSGRGFFEADQRIVQGQIDAAMKRLEARAVEIATGAREGNRGAIGDIARLLPGAGFAAAEPAGLAAAKEAAESVKRDEQWQKDEAKRKEDAAKARAKTAEEQAKADAKEAEDDAKAQAIFDKGQADYASGLAKMEADRRAMDAKQARVDADRQDRRRLQTIAMNETGTELTDGQAAEALTRADALIKDGMAPAVAGRKALGELIARLMQTAEQSAQMQGMSVADIATLNARLNNLESMQRATRTRLSRGRFEDQGDAGLPWSVFNDFTTGFDSPFVEMQERVETLMRQQPRKPSLLQWAMGQ